MPAPLSPAATAAGPATVPPISLSRFISHISKIRRTLVSPKFFFSTPPQSLSLLYRRRCSFAGGGHRHLLLSLLFSRFIDRENSSRSLSDLLFLAFSRSLSSVGATPGSSLSLPRLCAAEAVVDITSLGRAAASGGSSPEAAGAVELCQIAPSLDSLSGEPRHLGEVEHAVCHKAMRCCAGVADTMVTGCRRRRSALDWSSLPELPSHHGRRSRRDRRRRQKAAARAALVRASSPVGA